MGLTRAVSRRVTLVRAAALRQADELRPRLEGAETRRFYAQVLLRRDQRGDKDLAASLLRDAVADSGLLGMPLHEEMTCTRGETLC